MYCFLSQRLVPIIQFDAFVLSGSCHSALEIFIYTFFLVVSFSPSRRACCFGGRIHISLGLEKWDFGDQA